MARWMKIEGRPRRQRIMRKKITGTADRPRLCVSRSLNHIYVQLIDDTKSKTILALSTLSPHILEKVKKDSGNTKGAKILGEALAEMCKKKGISKAVFDRAGYLYQGRLKALAEAARKGGLEF